MNYSTEFREDLRQLAMITMEIAASREQGEVNSHQQSELATILDHILNTYPVEYEPLKRHIEDVNRIYRSRDHEHTASKHIATIREAFIEEVCDDYTPTF